MESILSSTASRMSDVAANAVIEDSTTIPETPPSQAGVDRHDPIDDFLQSSDNDIPEIGSIPIVSISSVGVIDSSGDIFNSDVPVSDVMGIEGVEDEGIAIELVDRADGDVDSDDNDVAGTPPIAVNMKRSKHTHVNHEQGEEMNLQEGNDDIDGGQVI
jgi:hypothetical protein